MDIKGTDQQINAWLKCMCTGLGSSDTFRILGKKMDIAYIAECDVGIKVRKSF